MSSEDIYCLKLSLIEKFESPHLELSLMRHPYTGTHDIVYTEEVKNGEIDGSLHQIAQRYLTKRISPQAVEFDQININAAFLKQLASFVDFEKRSLELLTMRRGEINLNQKEFEGFFCPFNLRGLFLDSVHLPDKVDVNDKILTTISRDITIRNRENLPFLQITDELLEHWKIEPPKYISLDRPRTSFTIKKVNELIMVFVKKQQTVFLNFGVIRCHENDRRYLLQLQKIHNSNVDIQMGTKYRIICRYNKFISSRFFFECDFL